jgi:hypothetical protein
MGQYRAYVIGDDGHIMMALDLLCADDHAAKEQALQLADGHDIELWQIDRRIAIFERGPK